MLFSGSFTAVLDACVLYPASLRDFLLRLAEKDMYRPKWSNSIHREWITSLLKNRPDLDEIKLAITMNQMNESFPDAMVTDLDELIHGLSLPDSGDNHVLATAIKGNADVIITLNLKDFPTSYLSQYNVDALQDFLCQRHF